MRGETGAAAICDVQFAVAYKHQGLAIEQLSYEVVVGLNPFEAQNHNAPVKYSHPNSVFFVKHCFGFVFTVKSAD